MGLEIGDIVIVEGEEWKIHDFSGRRDFMYCRKVSNPEIRHIWFYSETNFAPLYKALCEITN